MNYFRANTQGKRHIRYYKEVLERLENNRPFRAFFEQETTEVPTYFRNSVDSGLDNLYQSAVELQDVVLLNLILAENPILFLI